MLHYQRGFIVRLPVLQQLAKLHKEKCQKTPTHPLLVGPCLHYLSKFCFSIFLKNLGFKRTKNFFAKVKRLKNEVLLLVFPQFKRTNFYFAKVYLTCIHEKYTLVPKNVICLNCGKSKNRLENEVHRLENDSFEIFEFFGKSCTCGLDSVCIATGTSPSQGQRQSRAPHPQTTPPTLAMPLSPQTSTWPPPELSNVNLPTPMVFMKTTPPNGVYEHLKKTKYVLYVYFSFLLSSKPALWVTKAQVFLACIQDKNNLAPKKSICLTGLLYLCLCLISISMLWCIDFSGYLEIFQPILKGGDGIRVPQANSVRVFGAKSGPKITKRATVRVGKNTKNPKKGTKNNKKSQLSLAWLALTSTCMMVMMLCIAAHTQFSVDPRQTKAGSQSRNSNENHTQTNQTMVGTKQTYTMLPFSDPMQNNTTPTQAQATQRGTKRYRITSSKNYLNHTTTLISPPSQSTLNIPTSYSTHINTPHTPSHLRWYNISTPATEHPWPSAVSFIWVTNAQVFPQISLPHLSLHKKNQTRHTSTVIPQVTSAGLLRQLTGFMGCTILLISHNQGILTLMTTMGWIVAYQSLLLTTIVLSMYTLVTKTGIITCLINTARTTQMIINSAPTIYTHLTTMRAHIGSLGIPIQGQHILPILLALILLRIAYAYTRPQYTPKKTRWIRHRQRLCWIPISTLLHCLKLIQEAQQATEQQGTQTDLQGGGRDRKKQPKQKQKKIAGKKVGHNKKQTSQQQGTSHSNMDWLAGTQADKYLNTDKHTLSSQNIPIAGIPAHQGQFDSLTAHMTQLRTQQTSIQQHQKVVMASSGVHWVLLQVKSSTQVIIWDPYGSPIPSVLKLQKIVEECGWKTQLQSTGQQPPSDSNTCGYRIILWLTQFLDQEKQNSRHMHKWVPTAPEGSEISELYNLIQDLYPVTSAEDDSILHKPRAKEPKLSALPPSHTEATNTTLPSTQRQQPRRTETAQPKGQPAEDSFFQFLANKMSINPKRLQQVEPEPQAPKKPTQAKPTTTAGPTPQQEQSNPKPNMMRRMRDKAQKLKYGTSILAAAKARWRRGKHWRMSKLDRPTKVREMTINSHNLQGGWNNPLKRQQVDQWLASTQPAALIIQEPGLTKQSNPWTKMLKSNYKTVMHIGTDYSLLTLIHPSMETQICRKEIIRDKQGRFMAVPLKILQPGKKLWLVNIYGPVRDEKEEEGEKKTNKSNKTKKEAFWHSEMPKLWQKMLQHSSDQDIHLACTDANSVINPVQDSNWDSMNKTPQWLNQEQQHSKWFQIWIAKFGLLDMWRIQHPNIKQYTRTQGTNIHKRIDYILSSHNMANIITETSIIPNIQVKWTSDHDIIQIKMVALTDLRKITTTEWIKPLIDPRVIRQNEAVIRSHLDTMMEESTGKQGGEALEQIEPTVMQAVKENNIRQKPQWVTITKTPWQSHKMQELDDKMDSLKEELEQAQALQETVQEKEVIKKIKLLKKQMQATHKKQSQLRQSIKKGKMKKQTTVMEWEKIQWQQTRKPKAMGIGMRILRDEKGEIKAGADIEPIVKAYMGKMWGTKEHLPINTLSSILPISSKQTTDRLNQVLNTTITRLEVQQAIKKLKKNKTPGADLIPNEIFQLMQEKEITWLTNHLEKCRENNQFPKSWKEAELRWIFKKDDPLILANYRPIALLQVSYKIFMRIYTTRLERAIETEGLVSDEQQGFRTDRSCHSAALILEIIKGRRKQGKKPLHVAFLDISKAYDTVNHEILFQIMKNKGIQGTYLENIKELYTNNILSTISPEGKMQGTPMNRGIRQGCPLSPLLFALYVDIVTGEMQKLNKNTQEPSMLLYADDMVIWADTQAELQEKMQKVVETMQKLRLQLSLKKTEVQHNQFQQPSLEGETIQLPNQQGQYTYQPSSKAIRYLGTWSNMNMDNTAGIQILKEKMEQRLTSIRETFSNPWTKTKLTKGKVLSTWSYIMGTQTMEMEDLEAWDQEIAHVILGYANINMCRDLLYLKPTQGGMGMDKLTEEYTKQRMKTLANILMAGDRQRERGQTPWAQKMLLEELSKTHSEVQFIREMKKELQALNIQLIYNPEQKTTEQKKVQPLNKLPLNPKTKITQVSSGLIQLENSQIPTQLLTLQENMSTTQSGYKDVEHLIHTLQKAQDLFSQQTQTPQTEVDIHSLTGLRLTNSCLQQMSNQTKREIVEWGVDTLNRSTENIWTTQQLSQLQEPSKYIILANMTAPQATRQHMHLPNTTDDPTQANQICHHIKPRGGMVIRISQQPMQATGIPTITINTNTHAALELPLGTSQKNRTPTNNTEVHIQGIFNPTPGNIEVWQQIVKILSQQADMEINNMYMPDTTQDTTWQCPCCSKQGKRRKKE